MAQPRKGTASRPGRARAKPPAAVFACSLMVLIVAMLLGGLRLQIGLKRRTLQGNSVYVEDTAEGTGCRYGVLVSSADTGGEYFTIEGLFRPTAGSGYEGKPAAPPPHFHTMQDEIFVIKSGSCGYFYGTKDNVSVAHAGDTLVVPKGVPHTVWVADTTTDLLLTATLKPAGAGEIFFETLAGLGHDYGSVASVSPLQLLLSFSRAHVVLVDMPPWAWSLVQSLVLPFAEVIGYKAFYPEYRFKHDAPQAS